MGAGCAHNLHSISNESLLWWCSSSWTRLALTRTLSASNLGSKGKNGQFGWGLVNPPKALEAVAAQIKSSDASSKNR